MPFHVRIRTKGPTPSFEMRFDLSEEDLQRRIIDPYDQGADIVIGGRTVSADQIDRLEIFETEQPSTQIDGVKLGIARQGGEWLHGRSFRGANVTDRFIDRPPGTLAKRRLSQQGAPDPRTVFVVHGRHLGLRDSIFAFLRAIGLNPLEFSVAATRTGKATPYVGEILDAAFANAQAVLVLFTPDDEARLRPLYLQPEDPPHERELTPQARPNVLFEAGMAMGRDPDRTVLVEVGAMRPFSDVFGRYVVRLNDTSPRRQELAKRLEVAGCPIDLSATDWYRAGNFSVEGELALPALSTDEIASALEPNDAELAILKLMTEDRESNLTVRDIAWHLDMTEQRSLYHLERLEEQKLVLRFIYLNGLHEWLLSNKGRAFMAERNLL